MSKKQPNGTTTFDRHKRLVCRGPNTVNNCTEKQAGKHCWETNSTEHRKTKAEELGTSNNKRLNGDLNYNSSSSSSEENSDPESSEQDSLASSTSDANSSLNAAHLSEAQAQFLKRYKTKNKDRIVSSADSYSDSSEDESKVANTTKKAKKLSKHKKKSVPKHFEAESQKSESDGTFSSSADSDDGNTTESLFGSSSSIGSPSSDSDESTNTQCPGLEESFHSTRNDHDSDEEYRLYKSMNLNARKRSAYRTRSLPTLLDHAAMTSRSRSPHDSRTDPPLPGSLAQQLVGNLRWPFTNLYVKELQIVSDLDESEFDESQHESEASSLPNSTSLSFPGRQKNIMLGRVWTPAWWAVNSGLAGEHVIYTDVNSTGW